MRILIPPEEKNIPKEYFYPSDYYFEHCVVGKLYTEWTDKLLSFGVKLDTKYDMDLTSDYVSMSGYNPNIIHMGGKFFKDSIFKISWNHNESSSPTDEQIKQIANMFCIDGWEIEKSHTGCKINTDDMSTNSGDICKYTKPWVNYLTFQGSRTILQFDIMKYNRIRQLNMLLD